MRSQRGSTSPSRRPRDAEATKVALLRAATEVFSEAGYAGARVDDIAERAKVNKRMIYAYFEDKEGIYREVLRSRLASLPLRMDEQSTPREALGAAVRWFFKVLSDDPAFTRLLAWSLLTGAGDRRYSALVSSSAVALEQLSEVVRRGIRAGVFRADLDPELVRTTVISTVLGYFLQHEAMVVARAAAVTGHTDEDFVESFCRVLFEGISRGKPSRA